MASIYDRDLQESTLFELFESGAYSDTLNALKLAKVEIINKILSISGDTWTKRRLKEVQKAIDVAISDAYAPALPLLHSEMSEIAKVTAKNVLLTDFSAVPTKVLDQITSPSFLVQGYETKELFSTISDNHARQLRVLVASGVAQGKPPSAIVTEFAKKHSLLSDKQLKNAVFTTVTEARAVTRHDSYKQMEKNGSIIGYEYVATLDGRTTEYCRNHDGRKYYKSIDEIQGEINVHFHCRSLLVPLTKSTEDSTRASMNGPVQDEPYSKWFARQSEYFKKSVLGKKKYDSYVSGVYKVGGLPDVVGKVMTLASIAEVLSKTTKEAIEEAKEEEE